MGNILSGRVLGAIVVVLAAMIGSTMLAPVPLPGIQLPAEPIHIGPITLPNTFIATLLADITLLAIAFTVGRNLSLIPSGMQNVIEAVIEAFYDLTENIAGHNAAKFFPWIMTIFLLVLVSNWWELVPGVDSIGWLETHTAPGTETVLVHYEVRSLLPGVATIVKEPYTPSYEKYKKAYKDHVLPTNPDGKEVAVMVPFLRAAATDLNFTFALALISMFMVQYYGIQALGLGYFNKFFNFKGGAMGFIVGIIELISEFAKVLSFGFRLFGNIFGGQVLLFVMAFLIPWLLPVPFYGLELFIGFIQAFVFAMLTLVFFAVGVESHDGDHH